jgi:hypothetical protein
MDGVYVVVEGETDWAVAQRLLSVTSHRPHHQPLGLHGKATVDGKLCSYNAAARGWYWLVLRDLDTDADCAPTLRGRLLPEPSPHMAFRIAVRAVESWLMGDREKLAAFLHVRLALVPLDPESLVSPKDAMVALARRSRRQRIRDDMAPQSAARVGPRYAARLAEFVTHDWRPEVASERCDSLRRCLDALRQWR